jgi:shikimate kinase / 3-dehydroquinate synthase
MVAGMKKILLYGPPGSGKSMVGRYMAQSLNLSFLDLDDLIESKAGMSIAQIMTERGETAFRIMEAEALGEALQGRSHLIALGGGALLRSDNRRLAESAGKVICLAATLDTLTSRLQADENSRPLLEGDLSKKLRALLAGRGEHYESFQLCFETDRQTPAQIAWRLQITLGRFRVNGMGNGYDVLVEPGGLVTLGELLREREVDGSLVLVTDSNVGPLYGPRALESLRKSGYDAEVVTLPAGEPTKTLETASWLWQEFLRAGLDRKSTIIALGGGVTGDLAGFAGSTFMRGIAWIGVPSSLLAMADSSLGGKTGFDFPEAKNLIGTFHAPRLVLADPEVLSTLPEAEFRSGLAEVVKHGIIADKDLFDLCSKGHETVQGSLPEVIGRAIAVKVKIIEEDPYERGPRAALNLGHTIGHAVETASGYCLRHGEAVSIGMVAEARLAERLAVALSGLSDRIASVLKGLGLPTEIPANLSRQTILQSMKADKKKAVGVIRFTLPVEIGRVEVGIAVDDLNLVFQEK